VAAASPLLLTAELLVGDRNCTGGGPLFLVEKVDPPTTPKVAGAPTGKFCGKFCAIYGRGKLPDAADRPATPVPDAKFVGFTLPSGAIPLLPRWLLTCAPEGVTLARFPETDGHAETCAASPGSDPDAECAFPAFAILLGTSLKPRVNE